MAPTTSPFCAALCGNLTVELGVAAEGLSWAPMGEICLKHAAPRTGKFCGEEALPRLEKHFCDTQAQRHTTSGYCDPDQGHL
jgi:hypothetical protein